MPTSGRRSALPLAIAVCAGVAWATTAPAGAGEISPYIIDGQPAEAGEYPFMVALTGEYASNPDATFGCGGSLVAPTWVLTAAHCAEETAGNTGLTLTARYGATDLSQDEGRDVAVVRIVNHPGYADDDANGSVDNDLSLLELAEPIDGPVLRVVEPGQEHLFAPETTATVVGWGGTVATPDEQEQETSDRLMEVDIPIKSDADCAAALGSSYKPAIHLCAGAPDPDSPQDGKDSCQGDSGGPLMVRDQATGELAQVGVVSFGVGEVCGSTYGHYVRLSEFSEFLSQALGGGEPGPAFNDIAGTTHQDNIEVAAAAGMAGGYSDGSYRPGNAVTRGQMATFLVKALGLEPGDPSRFTDTAGHPHAASIGAVADAGIAGGYSDGSYRPDALVTRGQMARFLANALELGDGPAGAFDDVAGTTHERAIGAVAERGIAGGYSDGSYRPDAVVSRGQMATFLVNAFVAAG